MNSFYLWKTQWKDCSFHTPNSLMRIPIVRVFCSQGIVGSFEFIPPSLSSFVWNHLLQMTSLLTVAVVFLASSCVQSSGKKLHAVVFDTLSPTKVTLLQICRKLSHSHSLLESASDPLSLSLALLRLDDNLCPSNGSRMVKRFLPGQVWLFLALPRRRSSK